VGEFSYIAVDKGGEHVTGTVEAVDRKSAVIALSHKGHFVTELAEKAKSSGVSAGLLEGLGIGKSLKFGSRRVSSKDILAMTSQLSTALRAGLPLLNGLELIHQQQNKIGMKEMLSDLIDDVSSGKSLSEAMEKHEKIFSPLYLSMIRVGETGGILDQTTAQLSDILTRDEKIKTNMRNASAYPIFVLIVGLISVVIIITWILPSILGTIQETGALLPLPTRILLGMSNFTKAMLTTISGWFILILIAAGLFYFFRWTKTKGRLQWDTFKLRIPILGSVLRTIAVGRFARTLGSLTNAALNRFMAIFPALLILLLALVIGFIIAATLLPIVNMTLSGGAF